MSKLVRLEYWGVEGVGRTKTAAQENAQRKVRSRIEGSHTSWYFQSDQHLLLVRRDPISGWIYQLQYPEYPLMGKWHSSAQCADSFEETRRCGANHFAKLLSDYTGAVPEALLQFMGPDDANRTLQTNELPPLPVETFKRVNGLYQVSFDFCQIVGYGANKKAARQDADRKITALFAESSAPWYLRDRGYLLLLWQDIYLDWSEVLLRPQKLRSDFLHPNSRQDFVTVRRRAIYNFAQEAYPETEQIHETVREMMGPIELDSHAQYCRWQKAYREAADGGKSEQDARLAADTAIGAPHTRMAS